MNKITAANWIAAARQSSPQSAMPQPLVFSRRPTDTARPDAILRAMA